MRTKIEVKHLAKVESATIYLDDLLLFVGDNNSGKTLLMELIYGIVNLICKWKTDRSTARISERENVRYIRFDEKWYEDVENEINLYLQNNKEEFILESFSRLIPLESVNIKFEDVEGFFYIATISSKASLEKQYPNGERESIFEGIKITNDIESTLAHRVLIDMIGMHEGEKQLFIPAARAGLQMLYRYFFASSSSGNAGIPLPVFEFLKFIQTYTNKTTFSQDEIELINFLEQNLMRGKVEFENNEFVFREEESVIPLNYASSMIHELSVFTSILKSDNKFGYIYYDEVENSVHPLVQGYVARALIRLCNSGRKLIVSTHSDTMAGKINNFILLSRMKNVAEKNEKIGKVGLTAKDMLDDTKDVMAYEFIKNKDGKVRVEALEFMAYPRIGYSFERFNENIDQLYDESNSIMGYNEDKEA